MSYKHRFMYIGLGGTGLKVGTELEQLLRRQICGADGNELIGKGKFSSYKRNQLPTYFQSVYIDYSQQEMAGLRAFLRKLDPTAIDRTASFVATLSSAAAYQHIASKLRAEHNDLVKDWLPGPDGEPTHAPMSTGAAQFPTVGRAALFDRLSDVGIDGVFRPMQDAFARLANSQGDLDAYTDVVGGGEQSGHSWVVIFVATSLSGGTGSGLFLDVVKIATVMAQQAFPGTEVFVIPLIAAPSAFKDTATGDQMRMLNLNFARGILDLSELVDHSNESDKTRERWFRQQYPGTEKVEYDITAGGAAAPLATTFLFSRPAAYQDAKDLWRSMAVYATTLVSEADSAVKADASGDMTGSASPESVDRFAFFQDIINLRSKNDAESLRTLHPTGIGRLSTVEAATASLSVPVKRLSLFLAQYMALKAADSLQEKLRQHSEDFSAYVNADVPDVEKEELLMQVVAKMQNGEKLQTLLLALNQAKHESADWFDGMATLKSAHNTMVAKCEPKSRGGKSWATFAESAKKRAADPLTQSELASSAETLLRDALRSLSDGWKGAMKRYQLEGGIGRLSLLQAVAVLRIMIERNVRDALENPGSFQSLKASPAPGRFARVTGGVSKVDATKDTKSIKSYMFDLYRKSLITAFSESSIRQQELRSLVDELERWEVGALEGVLALRNRKSQIEESWASLTAGSNNAGFRDWVPSRLTSRGGGDKLEKATVLLGDVLGVAINSEGFGLGTNGAWDVFGRAMQQKVELLWEKGADKPETFVQSSIEGLQQLFDAALASSAEGRPALLTTVEDVLRAAARVAPKNKMEGAEEDVREMGKALSELIPDGLVPDARDCKKAFVVVTYPGRHNADVEKYLDDRLHSNASLATILARSEVKFHASSTSDAITISIALALRGLMDTPEARNALRSWDTAYHMGGQMLKWRQRTGFADLARLSAVRDQLPVLQSLLHMIWDDKVRYYVSGTDQPADPRSVKLTDIVALGIPTQKMRGAKGETDELVIKIDRVGKLSGISNFMENYLRVILDLYCDSQAVDAEIVATDVSSYLAQGFSDADGGKKPSAVFRQIVDEVKKSAPLVAEAIAEAVRIDMPGPIGQAQHAEQFYTDELEKAFLQKHPKTPDSAKRKNLAQFWEQAETGKR